jgi:expansin (peptidoglycan-binding protein)
MGSRLALCAFFTVATIVACSSSSSSSSNAGSATSDGGGSGNGGGGGGGDGGGGGGDPGGGPRTIGQSEDGEATYYDATGAGNCSFDATPNDLLVAALNATEYDNAAVCGECLKVDGPNGSVTIRVVDKCPGCRANGGIDLSPQAFGMISPLSAGRISVKLTLVTCNVTGPLAYRYKDGSSQYWTAVEVMNHKLPITKMEYQVNGAFTDMPRQDYNYFLADSGVGAQPSGLVVRVTSSDGQQITDTLPNTFSSTAWMQGTSQFK